MLTLLLFLLSGGCAAPADELATGDSDTGPSLGKADGPAADGEGGVDAVKGWARERVSDAESEFEGSGNHRMPSPEDWADQVVYQIQVDRFNNGDTRNDGLNVGRISAIIASAISSGSPTTFMAATSAGSSTASTTWPTSASRPCG